MSKWESKKLLDVAYVIRGVTFDKGDVSNSLSEGLVPILRAGNIGNKLDTKNDLIYVPAHKVGKEQLLQVGDVAICMSSGSPDIVGKTSKLEETWKGSVGAFCAIIRFNQNVIPKFGALYFQSRAFICWRKQQAEGANIKNIRKSDLESLMLPVPPLTEQERIVLILDEAEEMKRLRAQASNRTADLIPALLDEMFGDIGSNNKKWNFCKLGEICMINPRFIGKELIDEDEVSFIPMSEVDQNEGRILSNLTVKFGDVKRGYTSFIDGDILFAKITPCMENGKAAFVNNLFNGVGFGSTEFHVLRPKKEIDAIFLLSLIRRESFRQQAKASFTGTAGQKRVPVDFLINYSLALPPLALQKEFAARVEEIRAISSDQSVADQKLESLFQSLLHRAFEGEL